MAPGLCVISTPALKRGPSVPTVTEALVLTDTELATPAASCAAVIFFPAARMALTFSPNSSSTILIRSA